MNSILTLFFFLAHQFKEYIDDRTQHRAKKSQGIPVGPEPTPPPMQRNQPVTTGGKTKPKAVEEQQKKKMKKGGWCSAEDDVQRVRSENEVGFFGNL